MGKGVLIRLQGPADKPTYTAVRDAGADHQGGMSSALGAEDLAACGNGKSVQVLVPSSEILMAKLQLPKASASRLAKAIPYALEDCIVDDVEALHFAFAVERNGVAVAAVARSTLDTWLRSLRSVGIEPNALIPDVLALPRLPNTWSLFADRRQVLVRTGDHCGFAVELEALHNCLEAALREAKDEPPEQLYLYGTDAKEIETIIAQGFSTTTPTLTRPGAEGNGSDLGAPSVLEHVTSGLNLLQGAYAPRGAAKTRWIAWRISAGLTVLLIVALGANELSERSRLQAANDEADARLETLFRTTFPDIRRAVNPMAQMEQQLQALRARQNSVRGDFLALLAEGGAALDALDGLQVESIDYQNGRLDFDLIVRDVQALDELKRTLGSQSKLAIEIISATAANDAVRSRIRIERASS